MPSKSPVSQATPATPPPPRTNARLIRPASTSELTAVGCGGFFVEAGGDPLHGRFTIDEHRQPVIDDELVEEWRFLVRAEFHVGALCAPVATELIGRGPWQDRKSTRLNSRH